MGELRESLHARPRAPWPLWLRVAAASAALALLLHGLAITALWTAWVPPWGAADPRALDRAKSAAAGGGPAPLAIELSPATPVRSESARRSATAAAHAEAPHPPIALVAPTAPPATKIASTDLASITPVQASTARQPRLAPDGQAEDLAQPSALPQSPLPATGRTSASGQTITLTRPVPIYPTRPPPPVALRYTVSRGAQQGQAQLDWGVDAAGYRLHLSSHLPGSSALVQDSQGALDAAGLLPERHTDQRGRRAPKAVHFQREAGVVGFSARDTSQALMLGVQDRLSWSLQLAAIAAADPERVANAGEVLLAVASVDGSVGVWTFRFTGIDTLNLPAGNIAAQHWLREPPSRFEPQLDVWLAPSLHHLPVRLRWQSADRVGVQWELQSAQMQP